MKVDIVTEFHDKWDTWSRVLLGIDNNSRYVNRLIVMCDGRWEGKYPQAPKSVPTVFLDRERRGHGTARATNEAVEHVETPFFVHIDADLLLLRDSISMTLEYADEPARLVAGRTMDSLDDLHPRDGGGYESSMLWNNRNSNVAQGKLPPTCLRYCYFLADTAAWRTLGGNNPDEFMVDGVDAYYSLDYVLACRWIAKYGLDSFCLSDGWGIHVGYIKNSITSPAECQANIDKHHAYLNTFKSLYSEEECDKWRARFA